MLSVLHIENIAVIDSADIEFHPGLNVLTGETGAGKSIIIDALCTLMGERTSRDIIRTGEKSALVSGVFRGAGYGAGRILSELGIEPEADGSLHILRQVYADGRNACRINGRPAPLSSLRELGSFLIRTHGQNDSRSLLDPAAHIRLLDAYAGTGEGELLEYAAALEALKGIRAMQKAQLAEASDKERRLDLLRYKINEIESSAVNPGEDREIEERLKTVRNAEKLASALEAARAALLPDDGPGAASALESAASALAEITGLIGGKLPETVKELYEAAYSARDAAQTVASALSEYAFSEQELDRLEQRRALLSNLKKKYGPGLDNVLGALEAAKKEEETLLDSDRRAEELSGQYAEQYERTMELAKSISARRAAAAERLSAGVNGELSYLRMEGARFRVSVIQRERSGRVLLGADGIDIVEFYIAANRGEEEKPLSKSASGGELSRIMLAINTVSADPGTKTLVFDEIDTGISGIAASRVADRLSRLAHGRQILCVTHLSQLAAMADTHFQISKTTRDGRTFTEVCELDAPGRAGEIARINAGENCAGPALEAAAAQLEAAREAKDRARKQSG